jgi:hypothetical protein
MLQALHIFRKDIRHLWPELTVYILLLAVHAQAALALSDQGGVRTGTALGNAAFFMGQLIHAVWLVLVARAVQDEAFVGTDRFWLTRPYRWYSLLSAKLLFYFVAVLLPYFLMQLYIVFRAGMHPFGDIPGLLSLMAQTMLTPQLLCLLIAAAVTATIGQAFFIIVGILLSWIIVLSVMDSAGSRMAPPYASEGFGILFALVLLGTLIYQYRQRNTPRMRLVFGSTVAALFLIYIFVNLFNAQAPARWLLPLRYHPAPDVKLRFDASQTSLHRDETRDGHGLLGVTLPLRVDGLAPRERLSEVNTSFHLEGGGVTYNSPWRSTAMDDNGMTVVIPKGIWERIRTTPVQMHVSVVAMLLQPGTKVTGPANETLYDSEGGICRTESQGWACHWSYAHRFPLLVEGTTCLGSAAPAKAIGVIGAGGGGDPTWPFPARPILRPCPGSTISFTTYHATGGIRMDTDLPALILRDFRDR